MSKMILHSHFDWLCKDSVGSLQLPYRRPEADASLERISRIISRRQMNNHTVLVLPPLSTRRNFTHVNPTNWIFLDGSLCITMLTQKANVFGNTMMLPTIYTTLSRAVIHTAMAANEIFTDRRHTPSGNLLWSSSVNPSHNHISSRTLRRSFLFIPRRASISHCLV